MEESGRRRAGRRFRVTGISRNAGFPLGLEEQDLVDAFERMAQTRLLRWALEGDRLELEAEAAGEPSVWEGITFLWLAAAFDWEVKEASPAANPQMPGGRKWRRSQRA